MAADRYRNDLHLAMKGGVIRRLLRWLRPGSALSTVAVELLLLAVATGLVYLIVMWMGDGVEIRNSGN